MSNKTTFHSVVEPMKKAISMALIGLAEFSFFPSDNLTYGEQSSSRYLQRDIKRQQSLLDKITNDNRTSQSNQAERTLFRDSFGIVSNGDWTSTIAAQVALDLMKENPSMPARDVQDAMNLVAVGLDNLKDKLNNRPEPTQATPEVELVSDVIGGVNVAPPKAKIGAAAGKYLDKRLKDLYEAANGENSRAYERSDVQVTFLERLQEVSAKGMPGVAEELYDFCQSQPDKCQEAIHPFLMSKLNISPLNSTEDNLNNNPTLRVQLISQLGIPLAIAQNESLANEIQDLSNEINEGNRQLANLVENSEEAAQEIQSTRRQLKQKIDRLSDDLNKKLELVESNIISQVDTSAQRTLMILGNELKDVKNTVNTLKARSDREIEEKREAAKKMFEIQVEDARISAISSIGRLIGDSNPELANRLSEAATLGGCYNNLKRSYEQLDFAFKNPELAEKAATIFSANVLSASLTVATLFSNTPSSDQIMMGHLKAISRQLVEIRKELREMRDEMRSSNRKLSDKMDLYFYKTSQSLDQIIDMIAEQKADYLEIKSLILQVLDKNENILQNLDRSTSEILGAVKALASRPEIERYEQIKAKLNRLSSHEYDKAEWIEDVMTVMTYAGAHSRDTLANGPFIKESSDLMPSGLFRLLKVHGDLPDELIYKYSLIRASQSDLLDPDRSAVLPNEKMWLLWANLYCELLDKNPSYASLEDTDNLSELINDGKALLRAREALLMNPEKKPGAYNDNVITSSIKEYKLQADLLSKTIEEIRASFQARSLINGQMTLEIGRRLQLEKSAQQFQTPESIVNLIPRPLQEFDALNRKQTGMPLTVNWDVRFEYVNVHEVTHEEGFRIFEASIGTDLKPKFVYRQDIHTVANMRVIITVNTPSEPNLFSLRYDIPDKEFTIAKEGRFSEKPVLESTKKISGFIQFHEIREFPQNQKAFKDQVPPIEDLASSIWDEKIINGKVDWRPQINRVQDKKMRSAIRQYNKKMMTNFEQDLQQIIKATSENVAYSTNNILPQESEAIRNALYSIQGAREVVERSINMAIPQLTTDTEGKDVMNNLPSLEDFSSGEYAEIINAKGRAEKSVRRLIKAVKAAITEINEHSKLSVPPERFPLIESTLRKLEYTTNSISWDGGKMFLD